MTTSAVTTRSRPAALGVVERDVGAVEHPAHGPARGARVGDAEADGDVAHRLAERLAQLLGERRRARQPGVGQHDRELLAADAAEHVGAALRGRDRVGEQPQRAVARGVALRVVDPLEVVDVEHDERARRRGPVGARELGLEPLLEGAAVERAGQRVVGGEVAQLRDEARGPLAQHEHDARSRRRRRSPTAMNIASRSPGSTHAASAIPQHSSANAKFAAISARGRK